jgi:prophage regulatory protein
MRQIKPLTYPGRVVDALLGSSKSSRYARQDPKSPQYDPTWPLPIKISTRCVAYRANEIEAWVASRPRTRVIKQEDQS